MTTFLTQFNQNIQEIEQIPKNRYILKLLYANVITLMETYLYELFINGVRENNLYQKIVNNRNYQQYKIPLKLVEVNNFDIKNYIKTQIVEKILFHKTDSFLLFENVFEIQIDITEEIKNAIKNRHHIIHRNGKDFNNQNIEISEEYLNELIEEVRAFLTNIDRNFIDKYAIL